MKPMVGIFTVAWLAIAGASVGLAAESGHVGIVRSLSGEVTLVRSDRAVRAEENMKLQKRDLVRTGANSKVGMIFEDDTVVSLGPNSTMVVDDFLFQPNENKLSFIAHIIRGTASYLSGQIARLAPNNVKVVTPHATVGMRGTHVLVKVEGGE